MEEGRAAGVCGRTPGTTVWKVLPSAGAKSTLLCVHSSSPHCRASQLRSVLQTRGLTPRVLPESLLWQEARGAPAASHNGISSRPCPGEPPAPLPNCQPRGEPRAKDADVQLTSPASRPLTCVCGLWVKALAITGCSRAQPPGRAEKTKDRLQPSYLAGQVGPAGAGPRSRPHRPASLFAVYLGFSFRLFAAGF